MTEKLDDTWHWREYPVLVEAVRGVDADTFLGARFDAIAAATGLSLDDVYTAARALEVEGLIEIHAYMGPGHSNRITRVSGEARRRAGTWPSAESALDRIIAALEAIAANTDDEDTRSNARKTADWLGRSVNTVGLAVAGAAISGQIPGV